MMKIQVPHRKMTVEELRQWQARFLSATLTKVDAAVSSSPELTTAAERLSVRPSDAAAVRS